MPVEELATLAYGGSVGWLLLYLCGRLGAAADRVAGRETAERSAEPGRCAAGRSTGAG